MKDLQKLSEQTGIPMELFKKALGVRVEHQESHLVMTVDEASVAYRNAEIGHDSKAEKATLAEWNKLSMQQVIAAHTIREVQIAWQNSPDDSKARKAAWSKWKKFSLEQVAAARSVDSARFAYENAPNDRKVKKIALAEWNKLSLERVNAARVIEQVENAYKNAPNGSRAQKAALRKMYELFQ
jgi:hypothetical protein